VTDDTMLSQTTALSLEDYAHAGMVLMDRYCYTVISRSSVFFASVRQTINGSPSFVQAENNRLPVIQDRCRMTSQSLRLGLLRPSVIRSRQRSLSVYQPEPPFTVGLYRSITACVRGIQSKTYRSSSFLVRPCRDRPLRYS